METINEVIVVEGRHDAFKVQAVFQCDVFITFGYRITKRKLQLLQNLQRTRGLILFLDPDVVGEKIRKKIKDSIEGCKDAYLPQEKAKTSKKIGVEHAVESDIYQALKNVVTYLPNSKETVTIQFLIDMQLTNHPSATERRKKISDKLYLGKCNFKTLYKKLNVLQISEQEIKDILQ